MDRNTVYTKTAKGITQVNQRSASLSKDLMKVLKLIDRKSNFGQLLDKADVDKGQLEKALITLAKDGYARVFETRKEEADPFAAEDDFDFTAAGKIPASTQRVIPGAGGEIQLTDAILGRENEWLSVFDPNRLNPLPAAKDNKPLPPLPELVKMQGDVGRG